MSAEKQMPVETGIYEKISKPYCLSVTSLSSNVMASCITHNFVLVYPKTDHDFFNFSEQGYCMDIFCITCDAR
jgi:hypothetical protein